MSQGTISEIKKFVEYAQLFLEKEIDIFMILDAFAVKTVGMSLKSTVQVLNEQLKSKKTSESKVEKVIETVTANPSEAITKVPVVSTNLVNQIVKVICCIGIESNNPKVKRLGPNFAAKVLSDDGDMLRVQVVEKNFDPFIFSLPKEDVEVLTTKAKDKYNE